MGALRRWIVNGGHSQCDQGASYGVKNSKRNWRSAPQCLTNGHFSYIIVVSPRCRSMHRSSVFPQPGRQARPARRLCVTATRNEAGKRRPVAETAGTRKKGLKDAAVWGPLSAGGNLRKPAELTSVQGLGVRRGEGHRVARACLQENLYGVFAVSPEGCTPPSTRRASREKTVAGPRMP